MTDFSLDTAPIAIPFQTAINRLQEIGFAEALWARRLDVWTDDQATREKIANRLGWLGAIEFVRPHLPRLTGVCGCRQPGIVHRHRAARHGRLEPRAGSAAANHRRRAGTPPLSRPGFGGPRCGARQSRQRRHVPVPAGQQVGLDDRAERHGRRSAAAPSRRRRRPTGARGSSRLPTRAPPHTSAPGPKGSGRSS